MGACESRTKPATPDPPELRPSLPCHESKDGTSSSTIAIGSTLDMRLKPHKPKRSNVTCGEAQALCGAVGTISLKGLKKGQKAVPNQDSWSVHRLDGGLFVFSVFDGHGATGHEVSNCVKRKLTDNLLGPVKPSLQPSLCSRGCLESAFADLELHAKACQGSEFSGTTATVAVFDANQGNLVTANVGDTTAVLGRREPRDGQRKAEKLTRDHDPGDEEERQRICASGGVVKCDGVHRVYKKGTKAPGLNLSRSLGDEFSHRYCGVSAEPDVHQFRTCAEEDQILLVCSDGIWGVFSPEEAVKFVSAYSPLESAEAAEALAEEAWRRWNEGTKGSYVDDTTVLLVNLHALKYERMVETASTVDSLSRGASSVISLPSDEIA